MMNIKTFVIILLLLSVGFSTFWNESFTYRIGVNVTSSSTHTFWPYEIQVNAGNFNYSATDGTDLKVTWLNTSSGSEQQIPHWIPDTVGWNESEIQQFG